MDSLKNKFKTLFNCRGCLGCCVKHSTATTVETSSNGLGNQDHKAKQHTVLFTDTGFKVLYSTSTSEMDYQSDDPSAAAGSTSNPSEFVNHGHLLWKETRQRWVANKKHPNKTQVREPAISWNATYESVLGTSKPFPQPIPLPEMVDFLVDIWEQEGLYD